MTGALYKRSTSGLMEYVGPGHLVDYYKWALTGDAGVSSRTIVQALTGAEVLSPSHPSPPLDPGDFGRCVRMLDLFPHLRDGIQRMATFHKCWPQALSDEWLQLEALYQAELSEKTGRCPRLYARLQELLR